MAPTTPAGLTITMSVDGVASSVSGLSVALGVLYGDASVKADLAVVALVDGCGKTADELEAALDVRAHARAAGNLTHPEMTDEAYTISVPPWAILWREGNEAVR